MSPTPEANKKAKGAADDTSRSGLAESSPQIDVAARGILRLAPRLLTRGGVALVVTGGCLVRVHRLGDATNEGALVAELAVVTVS